VVVCHAEFIAYARLSEGSHSNFGTRIAISVSASDIFIDVDFFASSSHAFALVFEFNGLCVVVSVFLYVNDL
jgi:hypothetical protein